MAALGVYSGPRTGLRYRKVHSLAWKEMRRWHYPWAHEPLYDIEGAAAYLNIPARWVADAVRAGKIRHERFGKHIRFAQEHLDELLAACEQPATASVVRLQRDRRRSRL